MPLGIRRFGQQLFDRPPVTSQASSHRWRRSLAERLVLAAERVPSRKDRDHRFVMNGRLAVSIRQPSEPAIVHPN